MGRSPSPGFRARPLPENILYVAIAAAVIACIGLWWFRLVLVQVRKMRPATRYGIYALVWLAYFILTMILIGRGQA